jgi:serpin B
MKTTVLPTMLALGLIFAGSGIAVGQAKQPPQTEFTFNMYRTVVKEKSGENVMVSPYSAQQALDIVRAGAAGNTKTEIDTVLGYTDAIKWETPAEGPLTTANALWTQQGYNILPAFLNNARENFDATVEQADFAGNSEDAVKRINTWVSEKTKGKIPKLFDELDNMTRVVVVNAVHFVSNWETQFNPKETMDADFTQLNGTKVKTKLMYRSPKDQMKYAETSKTQIVELPYKDKGFSMLILLPKNAADFAKWEEEMTAEELKTLRGALKFEKTNLWMPRFTVECSVPLNDTMKQLGMPTAFSRENADFTNINEKKELYISSVIQKTFIKVDETGTEAAAATGISISATSIDMNPPKSFRADRPFMYALVQGDTVLFLGRIVKPEDK